METLTYQPILENPRPQEGISVGFIQNEITSVRNGLLHNWQDRGIEARQFEPEFDRVCYVALNKFKYSAPEAYLGAKVLLDKYAENNLKTTVGERLHAALSQWNYEIKEDGIYTESANEKAIEMFQRGREFKREYGKEVDFAREDAELVGFYTLDKEIEESMKLNPLTGKVESNIPDGTMWISFSHPGDVENGSMYPKNFYDIFTAKTREGKKCIEARRYASSLSIEESSSKIGKYDREHYPEGFVPTTEHMLSHQVKISPKDSEIKDAEELHQYLHREHNALDSSQLEFVLLRIAPAIKDYLAGLAMNPYDKRGQLARLRGVLNAADASVDLITGKSGGVVSSYIEIFPMTVYELDSHREKKVETIMTACGKSGDYGEGGGDSIELNGFAFELSIAASVADFGDRDSRGSLVFDCPFTGRCGKKNKRPRGRILTHCQHCKQELPKC